MRPLGVLALAVLGFASCGPGDGNDWSVGRATGLLSSLDGCDCQVRDSVALEPTGRHAEVTCQRSAKGPLTMYLSISRAERGFSRGPVLNVDQVTLGSLVAERAFSGKLARFKGTAVETPYRLMYVSKLVFEGRGGVPDGTLEDAVFACDTYTLDAPSSPTYSEAFGEPSP